MKKNSIIAISIVLVIVVAIAYTLYNNKKEINDSATAIPETVGVIPVKVTSVLNKKVDNSASFTGNFIARKEVSLTAEAQGSIIQLNIKEGDKVKQGQVIARIDPTAIQTSLATSKASFNKAVLDKERYERLVTAGAISQKQYEDVALSVENAKANLASIQQQLKYTIIQSPMSGTVGEVSVEKGSFATVGMKIGNVVDVSKLKMVVQVGETDIVKIKKGQPVQIKTEVYPDQIFKGNVTLIGVQANAGRKYDVEVEVINNDNFPLKAGMFGTILLERQSADYGDKLFVPRKAIVGSIKDAKVFVLNPDSTVTLTKIEVDTQIGNEVTVRSGLNTGDQVVTTGQINLQSGKKVRVIQ